MSVRGLLDWVERLLNPEKRAKQRSTWMQEKWHFDRSKRGLNEVTSQIVFPSHEGLLSIKACLGTKAVVPNARSSTPKVTTRQKDQCTRLSSLRARGHRTPVGEKSVKRRLSCSALRGWAALSEPLPWEPNTRMWIFELISSSVITRKVFNSNKCRPLLYDFMYRYRKKSSSPQNEPILWSNLPPGGDPSCLRNHFPPICCAFLCRLSTMVSIFSFPLLLRKENDCLRAQKWSLPLPTRRTPSCEPYWWIKKVHCWSWRPKEQTSICALVSRGASQAVDASV